MLRLAPHAPVYSESEHHMNEDYQRPSWRDAEGSALPDLPPRDPANPRAIHPALAGTMRDRHALYWKLTALAGGAPVEQHYARALYDGRAALRTRAQLAAIKRRIEKGRWVSDVDRSTLSCLPAATLRLLDAEAEHAKRVRYDIATFGDRARAFHGLPLVGRYGMRRPRSSLRGGRPSCARRVRRDSTRSSDGPGESPGPGDGEHEPPGAQAPNLLAARTRLTCSDRATLTFACIDASARGEVQ